MEVLLRASTIEALLENVNKLLNGLDAFHESTILVFFLGCLEVTKSKDLQLTPQILHAYGK